MKTKILLLLAGASVLGLAGAALAADPIEPIVDPVYAPAADWTGFSIGLQAGIVSLSGYEDWNPDFAAPVDPYETWDSGIGGSLGIFAGYDIQVSDLFVLGVGGEVNWNSVSALEWPSFALDDEVSHQWDAGLHVRAGVLVTPDILAYGLLGYSWGSFDTPYWGAQGYDSPWTTSGVKIGAGVEALVADGFFVKGEVAATFYDSYEINDAGPYWLITPTVVSAKAGLGWKF